MASDALGAPHGANGQHPCQGSHAFEAFDVLVQPAPDAGAPPSASARAVGGVLASGECPGCASSADLAGVGVLKRPCAAGGWRDDIAVSPGFNPDIAVSPGFNPGCRKSPPKRKKEGRRRFCMRQQHMHPRLASPPAPGLYLCISRPWLLHRREMPPASISGGLAPRQTPSIRQIHRNREPRASRAPSAPNLPEPASVRDRRPRPRGADSVFCISRELLATALVPCDFLVPSTKGRR